MTRTLVLGVALWMTACGAREPARESREGPEKGDHKPPTETAPGREEDQVKIAEDVQRDLRITTARVEERKRGEDSPVLGELRVNEERYAEVSSPIQAQVVKLVAGVGRLVRQGDTLAQLSSLDVGRARGEYRQAEARLRVAQQALARKRGLAEERIVPQREVQEAEAEARAAEAAVQASRAALDSVGVTGDLKEGASFPLRSPVSGTVLDRAVVQGQVVEPGKALFKVGDLTTLWLVAHASERDAVRVRVGSEARVALSALPGKALVARVTLVGRQVEAASRTIPVRLTLANPGGLLRPGMSATAWLPIGDDSKLLSVPAAALQRLREKWCVFVPKGKGVFEVRNVGRGRDLGEEVEVLSGVVAGEEVVVEGAFLLKAEAEKAASKGGQHEH